jgi:hypothetical protein
VSPIRAADPTDAGPGVLYYVQHIIAGPNKQDATNLLKHWLTDQMVADTNPGDYGSLYCVWADLEGVADAFEDEPTFEIVAPEAAREWLAAFADHSAAGRGSCAGTLGLPHTVKTHTVFWKRPGFKPRVLGSTGG